MAFQAKRTPRKHDTTTFWNATHKKSHANINSAIKETQWYSHRFDVAKRSIFIRTVDATTFFSRLLLLIIPGTSDPIYSQTLCCIVYADCLTVCVSVDMLVSLKIETHSLVVAVWLSDSVSFASDASVSVASAAQRMHVQLLLSSRTPMRMQR